jgi:hypothetical protein
MSSNHRKSLFLLSLTAAITFTQQGRKKPTKASLSR